MAELELELNLGGAFRRAMITGLADMVDALLQYRYAVILELLKRDPLSRTMIAEAMGEASVREAADAAEERMVSSDFTEDDRRDLPWDEIMLEVLAELRDTPGGRGETLSPCPKDQDTA